MTVGEIQSISQYIRRQLFRLSPLSIALLYLIMGVLWIGFSDSILESLIDDVATLSLYQTYKGWFYILITGFFLYLLISMMQKERRAFLKDLEENERFYKNVFIKNPMPAFIYDIDTLRFLEVNDTAIRKYGYTKEEFLAMTIKDIRPQSDVPRLLKNLSQYRGNYSESKGWTHLKKNGEGIKVDIYGQPTQYKGRKSELVIAHDVTDQHLAKTELNQAYKRLRHHLSYTPLGVFEWDKDLRLTYLNSVAEEMFGYRFDEVVGKTPDEWGFVHEDDQQYLDDLTDSVIKEQKHNFTNANRNYTKDGRIIHCLWYNTAITDKNNNLESMLCLVSDITQQVEYENEIKELNANLEALVQKRTRELEAVNKELEAFTYSVSHDLRAPLRAINGFTEAYLQEYGDTTSPQGQKFLQRVINAADTMNNLIDNYLKLSRLTSSELTIQEFNLSSLAKQVVAEVQQEYRNNPVTLHKDEDIIVKADKDMMRIVLYNLFSNAVKFSSTKPESIIELRKVSDSELHITDNGVGFDMKYYDKLFKPFLRLHFDDEFKGSGIGLTSVQRIINRHGGTISAESIPGEKTTFKIHWTTND